MVSSDRDTADNATLGLLTLTLLTLLWQIRPIENDAKNSKVNETLACGTHLRVLSESYPMNTNMSGFR